MPATGRSSGWTRSGCSIWRPASGRTGRATLDPWTTTPGSSCRTWEGPGSTADRARGRASSTRPGCCGFADGPSSNRGAGEGRTSGRLRAPEVLLPGTSGKRDLHVLDLAVLEERVPSAVGEGVDPGVPVDAEVVAEDGVEHREEVVAGAEVDVDLPLHVEDVEGAGVGVGAVPLEEEVPADRDVPGPRGRLRQDVAPPGLEPDVEIPADRRVVEVDLVEPAAAVDEEIPADGGDLDVDAAPAPVVADRKVPEDLRLFLEVELVEPAGVPDEHVAPDPARVPDPRVAPLAEVVPVDVLDPHVTHDDGVLQVELVEAVVVAHRDVSLDLAPLEVRLGVAVVVPDLHAPADGGVLQLELVEPLAAGHDDVAGDLDVDDLRGVLALPEVDLEVVDPAGEGVGLQAVDQGAVLPDDQEHAGARLGGLRHDDRVVPVVPFDHEDPPLHRRRALAVRPERAARPEQGHESRENPSLHRAVLLPRPSSPVSFRSRPAARRSEPPWQPSGTRAREVSRARATESTSFRNAASCSLPPDGEVVPAGGGSRAPEPGQRRKRRRKRLPPRSKLITERALANRRKPEPPWAKYSRPVRKRSRVPSTSKPLPSSETSRKAPAPVRTTSTVIHFPASRRLPRLCAFPTAFLRGERRSRSSRPAGTSGKRAERAAFSSGRISSGALRRITARAAAPARPSPGSVPSEAAMSQSMRSRV